MTVKNKGKPQNKRKLSDSALQPMKPQKASFSTPQPQKGKNFNTPKQMKQFQKGQTPKQTPNSAKGKAGKSSPKGLPQTPKGKTPIKQKNVEEDDDEEEDEDDDEEQSTDMGSLFKGKLTEDDDNEEDDSEDDSEEDEDDDDDEEEDDEEDDDDDEEEEEIQPPSKRARLDPEATPVKQAKQNQKANTPSQSNKPDSQKTGSSVGDDARKQDRDSRTLFVKNLPGDCTVKEIKALSKDIKQVRLRINTNYVNKKRVRTGYAYLEFGSEAAAENQFKILERSMIKGNKLMVDYVGDKSKYKNDNKKPEPREVDPLRLYVAGLAPDVTEADMRKLFPKAQEITLPARQKDKKLFGYGFLQFSSPALAKQCHDKSQELTLKGMTLVVLYAKKRKEPAEKKDKQTAQKKKQEKKAKEPAAKKAKMEVDEEADDDDEDEDDSEEDDDEDSEDDDDEEEDDEDDDDDSEEDKENGGLAAVKQDDDEEDDDDDDEDDDDEEDDDDDDDDDDDE